ncbi:hypothetical protein J6590_064560 [Homalodisca vitripennis]|nr:hypothetical protein J6590_064560 [Homalodisca vitripennis]
MPMSERSKTLDYESELQIVQVRILSVTIALFISTIHLVLYRPPLILFDKILAQASGPMRTDRVRLERGSLLLKKKLHQMPLLELQFNDFASNHISQASTETRAKPTSLDYISSKANTIAAAPLAPNNDVVSASVFQLRHHLLSQHPFFICPPTHTRLRAVSWNGTAPADCMVSVPCNHSHSLNFQLVIQLSLGKANICRAGLNSGAAFTGHVLFQNADLVKIDKTLRKCSWHFGGLLHKCSTSENFCISAALCACFRSQRWRPPPVEIQRGGSRGISLDLNNVTLEEGEASSVPASFNTKGAPLNPTVILSSRLNLSIFLPGLFAVSDLPFMDIYGSSPALDWIYRLPLHPRISSFAISDVPLLDIHKFELQFLTAVRTVNGGLWTVEKCSRQYGLQSRTAVRSVAWLSWSVFPVFCPWTVDCGLSWEPPLTSSSACSPIVELSHRATVDSPTIRLPDSPSTYSSNCSPGLSQSRTAVRTIRAISSTYSYQRVLRY